MDVNTNSFMVAWNVGNTVIISILDVVRADGAPNAQSIMITNGGVFQNTSNSLEMANVSNLEESTQYIVRIRLFTSLKRSNPAEIIQYTCEFRHLVNQIFIVIFVIAIG